MRTPQSPGLVHPGSYGWAIEAAKQGYNVRRRGWSDSGDPNGKRVCLCAVIPEGMLSFLVLFYPEGHPKYPDGLMVPWSAPTRCDVFEDDWEIAP
jgi:hypothetical protein